MRAYGALAARALYLISKSYRLVASQLSGLPLDCSVDAVSARYPGEFIQFFFWNPERPHLVTFGVAPRSRSLESGLHGVTIDTRTAEIVDVPKPRRGVTLVISLRVQGRRHLTLLRAR